MKPNAEGSSKGVHRTSVVDNEQELREAAREMIAKYDQPALVEDYIAGREFTVGLLGERRPKVLPPMEVVFLSNDATALILTPLVYTLVLRLRLPPLPFMFACTFIADTASFVLPVMVDCSSAPRCSIGISATPSLTLKSMVGDGSAT